MRRTVIAVLATMALGIGLISPPAAQAASNAYVVTGHPISAPGLGLLANNYYCGDGTTTAQTVPLERQGGTVGAGALGWQVTPAGWVSGPQAVVAGDPYALTSFRTDVLAPSGTSGWVFVYFEDADDRGRSQNYGWAEVSLPASGSWQPLDVTNWTYTWDWYLDGTYQNTYQDTVQGFATRSGAIGEARFHVLLGCNGAPFYLDNLVVSHSTTSVSYDFEPVPTPPPPPPPPPHTVAHLEWSANGRDVETSDRLAIAYGQSIWLLGHSHVHAAAGNEWYSGFGSMLGQPTRGGTQALGRKGFDPEYYAAYKVSPTQETVYQFTAEATGAIPSATSNHVKVFVSSKVRASVVDRKLVQGQRLAVNGRVWPSKKGVKVTLQRKIGKKWKKIDSAKTRKRGKFSLVTKASSPGTWVVRVAVASTNTNLGTSTKSAKVSVRKYVPPKKNQPPPPPPVDDTPEQEAPVTTPTPSQVSSTAPTPPDRPSNTRGTPAPRQGGSSVLPGAKAQGASKDG
jgi:hypothetical protein